MRRALVPLITLMVLLASASAAGAKEWCVPPASGCADGNVGTFQSALNLAGSNAGPDSIRLGATTYTPASGGFTYDDGGSSTNSVAISGVSSDTTTLTRSSLGAILTITSGGGALNSLTDLGFHITQGSSTGLQGGRADATRVAVAGDPSITNSTGMALASGALRSVHVAMPVSGSNQGVFVTGGLATDGVFDSTISADIAVDVPLAVVQRCDITGGHIGVLTMSGRADDVVVHVAGSGSDRSGLVAANNSISSGSAVARHLTILGLDSSPGSIGIRVSADAGFTSQTESLDVRSTIVRGVEHSYRRAGITSPHTGTATLTMQYTDYDAATRDDSGPGTGPNPSDPTNPNTDPAFVDASHFDYRLSGASPLIDAGDPAALAAAEPNSDLAGRPRVVNGRTDVGAFEYQRQAPVITSATSTPDVTPSGNPFTFFAAATDADGDPITYAWSFDDGGTAAGASVQHAFSAEGLHVGTVTVSDPAGRTASAGVAVGVLPDPRTVLKALSVSPSKFRAGTGRKKGTTVRFTLKKSVTVTFTVDRSLAGRKVGGKCRPPTSKNRKAHRCTRHVPVGSFTRNGALGKNKFHFTGRLAGKALKPGGYRLVGIVGSGPDASVKRASFTVKR
jgi:PKD domain